MSAPWLLRGGIALMLFVLLFIREANAESVRVRYPQGSAQPCGFGRVSIHSGAELDNVPAFCMR